MSRCVESYKRSASSRMNSNSSQNPLPSLGNSSDNGPPNGSNHASSSGPSVPATSQQNGSLEAPVAKPPVVVGVQFAKTGGIGLSTTLSSQQAQALQQKIEQTQLLNKQLQLQQHQQVAQVQALATAFRSAGTAAALHPKASAVVAAPQQAMLKAPQKQPSETAGTPAWSVPNPLLMKAQPQRLMEVSNKAAPQQPMNTNMNIAPAPTITMNRQPIQQLPLVQQVPIAVQPVRPVLQPQPVAPMLMQQQQQPMKPKNKVILSQEAKQCLAKAIWSAIRSTDGAIDKDLMEAAMATGLPKHAILNAARVAREREALKRKGLQPQPRPQLQQQQQQPVKQTMPPQQTMSSPPPQPRPSKPKPSKSPISPAVVSSSKPSVPSKPKISAQQALAQKMAIAKLEERQKWNRVQNGVFMTQKGRFLVLPNSLSGIQRTTAQQQEPASSPSARKRVHPDILQQARLLQQRLQQPPSSFHPKSTTTTTTITLLDPEKFKRVKIEPKKHAKALDRIVRKGRQTASEALNKQHKELSKQISSHQQEFFKFHRSRRQEAFKLAKAIRDNLDKDHKKKEKDVVSAERARLAALKANDMDAYSKLLEETKNDRLKFLMDKTERHFSQISTSLLETRNKDGSVASSGGTSSYYASAHLKQEEVRQPSILTGGDLKEYQMGGLQWLISLYNNKLNGILADEMGLGKTIQAISLIAYLMEYKNNLGPYLVIVPLSTLSNWVNEFTKWCPSAHMICYKGTPAQRKELYKDQVRTGHFNVLLTTYEYIIKDKANLRKINWEYAIVDEGHRMKNSASKFAKTLSSQYTTKYRLLLTGTPLMNDLSELWALLNFLLPAIFNSVETFDSWFNRPFAQFGTAAVTAEDEANFLSNEERMFIIHRLHELLRPFMLRRVKSEVLDQLPEKVEKVLRCELSSWQKELYTQISKKVAEDNGLLAGNGIAQPQAQSRGLNNVVMQLRKVCNHPYLFSPEGYHINEKIIRSSGKLELLDRMLPKLRAAGHRILMFTQMTAVMTILEDYFAYRGYMSLRLDGSTPADEREKRMYKFNSNDSPYFIFLLSTRAGGLGLNLTAADTVIIFDSDWNPMMDLQAQDRAHRIGQRSEVSVFRLITYSPVEEKILSRATEKLNMSELVVEAGKFDSSSVEKDNSLERKKLMEVLLTDFETTTKEIKSESQSEIKSEITSEVGDDEDNDDDNASDGTDKEDLNDLLSNNENDYQLYDTIDEQRANDPTAVDVSLYTDPDDVPDWIKYPSGKKDAALQDTEPGTGARKRKEVTYDDGLTEKQFMRMMDKQADGELAAKEDAKATRRAATPNSSAESVAPPENLGSELTDWTFRKLTSCTKSVIALKDPSTKRRICEIFMEKPSPEQYPDYYEMVKKPIAINDILRKCRAKMYTDLQEFRDDWQLMFANARTFNGVGSWIDEDGKSLEKELERILKKNGFNEETPKQQQASPPKKKKFRIKLSLKSLKAKAPEPEPEPEEPEEEVKPTRRGRKPKKRKRD